jgi:hypothetical protein
MFGSKTNYGVPGEATFCGIRPAIGLT